MLAGQVEVQDPQGAGPAFPANTALSWFSCGPRAEAPCRSQIQENCIVGFFSRYLLSLLTSTASQPSDGWHGEILVLAREAEEALPQSSALRPVP